MATAEQSVEGRIVAIAAERRELAGLLHRAETASPVSLPVAFARAARIAGRNWLLAANGAGPKLARQATEATLLEGSVRAVVSTGYCGALDPAFEAGDVLVASEVWTSGTRFAAVTPVTARQAWTGPLISQDRVAWTADEKLALRTRGGSAVDMEAGAVAELAHLNGLPFYCVRSVSDTAATSLPMDFNRFRTPEGRFDQRRIARAVVWRPWLWPCLLQLDRNCRRASQTLGDFLAECQF